MRVCATRAGRRWIETLEDTSNIYGVEFLGVLSILMTDGDDLQGKTATIYIDNNTAGAIIRKSEMPIPIQARADFIAHRIRASASLHGAIARPLYAILRTYLPDTSAFLTRCIRRAAWQQNTTQQPSQKDHKDNYSRDTCVPSAG